MRAYATNHQLAVRAIAGTYVVLLAFDLLTEAAREDFLGFAIQRADLTAGTEKWLQGYRVFKETVEKPELGKLYSSRQHPVQDFLWGDYAAQHSHRYRYRIVPLYGHPAAITEGNAVEIEVETENVDTGTHAIYFNRGAAGSQAYAARFNNKPPDAVGPAAYTWLSRGLEEALLAFIAQAKGPEYALRASVYEFSYEPVMQALKAAVDAGADVQIIYDNRARATNADATALRAAVRAAVQKYGLENHVTPRSTDVGFISHNKFIVLARKEAHAPADAAPPAAGRPVPAYASLRPEQVWTGSTNFSRGGIFGHSNVGHLVRDPATAQAYLDYWQRLWSDPKAAKLRAQNEQATPLPTEVLAPGVHALFSPRFNRKGKAVVPPADALDWYIDRMAGAQSSVFFTAAFGINARIQEQLSVPANFLRYVLLESYGNKEAAQKLKLLQRDKTLRFAAGAVLDDDSAVHNWLMREEKLTGMNEHVKFIHTKYLLIDPLGASPLVVTGSANFSDASVGNNDENMLVIHGDKRVADIYLGEFMRLFQHYQFRELARRVRSAKPQERQAAFLDATGAWLKPWFTLDTPKDRQRRLFVSHPTPA
ncbi:phospholipase D-like domain-containing protein [Hymenobacter cellulosilyticus]|uniref:phospholipase D n=1 Tax=Hymenobacter cellulosilyticus TaxID=2932248 RepID=A0A8T9QKJ8_9BACT|nr:phospholipase D-like domain-containing protein [Hymenobacter cellulosilyticus]UOQ75253.1 phospholipase D-like domain-containing protein [Hymenobacter cellulosilyticus]